MINVSGAFKQQLYADKRNYLEYIKITLLDGTILELNNQHIWQGSLSFEDAVSADNEFQVGAAIVNKCDFTINNIYGDYDEYDFTGATVIVKIGLEVGEREEEEEDIGIIIDDDDDSQLIEGETGESSIGETGETSEGSESPLEEWITKGTYTVDTADYNDTYIKLSCLDNMAKFDKKFASTLAPSFPIQAGYLLSSICTYCGVSYNLTAFDYGTAEIDSLGDSETMTCRDVISWVAQIFGYYARCNASGALELKWFNRQGLETAMNGLDGGIFDDESSLIYVSGETADGGSFDPWETADVVDGGEFTGWANDVHYFSSTFSHSVSVDDVVITGVRILVKTGGTGSSEIATHMQGTAGYVVEISNNPIITESNVNAILTRLYTKLGGLTFRKANLSVTSDPSIEAGDVGIYWDRKGNYHPILISRATFSPGGSQTIVSSAQTPARNSSERYSAETRSYVEMRRSVEAEKTAREQAVAALQSAITNAGGLYASTVTDQSTGAVTYYLHNKPNRNESDIRIMFSDAGITVTNNGTDQTPTWYGLQVNGNMLINLLSATGIDASWINTGTLTVGGTGSMANGSISLRDSQNSEIVNLNKNGIHANVLSSTTYIGDVTLSEEGLEATSDYSATKIGPYYWYSSSVGWLTGISNDYEHGNAHLESNFNAFSLELIERGSFYDTAHSTIEAGYLYIYNNTENNYIKFEGDEFHVEGDLTVTGTKPRLVDTEDYGKRYLYCYETPTPTFGDIGEGVIGEDGFCYVQIDPTFAETVSLTQYQVFLQRYGNGDAFVKERHGTYFVVQGTPNLEFGWEIKARQRDYENYRLNKKTDRADINSLDYGNLAQAHIEQINQERNMA